LLLTLAAGLRPSPLTSLLLLEVVLERLEQGLVVAQEVIELLLEHQVAAHLLNQP
jgi:hypothetical protein